MGTPQTSGELQPATVQSLAADGTVTRIAADSAQPNTAPITLACDVPAEYKIVKVKKPDGTIVKVKRRVTLAKDTAAPNTQSILLSEEQKPSHVTPSRPVAPKVVSAEESQPKDVKKPVGAVRLKATSQGVHHRLSSARTCRLFRGVRRLHSDFESTLGALDPNGDLGDLGDDAEDYNSDSNSESSNSSSSSSSSKHGRGNGRRKSRVTNNKTDSASVYSYADGNSEYQQSDHDDNVNHRQGAGSGDQVHPMDNTAPTSHSRRHPMTKEATSVLGQIISQAESRGKGAENITASKGNLGVEVNEKDLRKGTDLSAAKAQRRQYRKLKPRSRLSQIVVWTTMIVFPVLFIVLGILTIVLTGVHADSNKGFVLTEAIKGAVTAWPIIFAAIVAQSLKQLASYKVERGLRLITLEQLISSHSVGAAIKQPFFLRRFDWIGIALLFLWSLSPLASQALQRMSYFGYVARTINITVPYIDTTGINSLFTASIPLEISGGSGVTQGVYTASLMAPAKVQASPIDTWNNTKIPLFEMADTMTDGWYSVNATAASQFSSLLGIPLEIPVEYNSDSSYEATNSELQMVMQSAYLSVTNCTPQVIKSKDEINQTILQLGTSISESPSGTLLMSMFLLGESLSAMSFDKFMRLPGILTYSSIIDTTDLLNGNASGVLQYSYTACNITQTFVDSQVLCNGGQCLVVGMRPSLNVTALSTFTVAGSLGTTGYEPFFVDSFVQTTSPGIHGYYSLTEQYIMDPTFAINKNANPYPPSSLNASALKLPDFQQRLALLVNTYWQAGFAPSNETTGSVVSSNGLNSGVKFAQASYYESYYAYVTSLAWVVIVLASSTILLAAGIASIFLDAYTVGPDVLGFASSMTRNNKYMDLPREDGTLSGAERARALGDVKVMMQDVKPGSEVGKIALGTVSPGTKKLTQGRLYR